MFPCRSWSFWANLVNIKATDVLALYAARSSAAMMVLTLNSLRPSDAYICVSKLSIFGSDNGLSPGRRQAIIWTNAGILLIGPLGTKFNEILIEIHTFSLKKMRLKVSSAKRRPFCLGLNVLIGRFVFSMRKNVNYLCLFGAPIDFVE